MKSLFVWCDLTGRVTTDPNVTFDACSVRFNVQFKKKIGILSSEPPKFLFVQICSLGDGEPESNRTELSWAV